MTFPENLTVVYALLILVGLAIGWTLLKFFLRLTMRIFTCGCLALTALVAVAWLLVTQPWVG